ncbi:MAG TPA: RNA chaperone Hfq [Candidatus Xenobia bacterium]|nr:RNA chaperone Hfq [Candidatus Xenobia bacterium]
MNRRLIRPSLAEVKEQLTPPPPRRKPVPPEQTHAEEYYYVKQMQARTPVVVVLTDGELIRGTVEWYDRDCIKITRSGVPNLLLYKSAIKYIYKDESANGGNGQPAREPALAHVPDDNGGQNF